VVGEQVFGAVGAEQVFGAVGAELVLGAAVGGVVAEAVVAEAAGADGVSTSDWHLKVAFVEAAIFSD
jgi:hypothetical protein